MSHQIKVWETKKKVKIPEYKLAFRIAYEATPILSLRQFFKVCII